ncbi:MAG: sigma-70 family RNA polymerase sigma factor [Phycisphaerae bacterium]|nr:sigma-70 family RNA polymerase sigma factor [Phycisphaerae bacterium]
MDTTSTTLLERVRDAAEAEEVAQECMESLARHLRSFQYSRSRGRFRSFLRRMANNQIANRQRRKRLLQARSGELEGLAAPESTEQAWDRVWLREHLAYCLKNLASRCSDHTIQAFRLYALEDWPVEKVCRKLDLSANQVYLAKTRMIRRLRKEITQFVGDVL